MEKMFAFYFLAGLACFITLFTLFNRYYIIFLPRRREKLFLVIEEDIPHIEAVLRELYSFLRRKAWFEPVIIDRSTGESHLITEKFCQSYTLPLEQELPPRFAKQIVLDSKSDIRQLKREISLLRTEIELPMTAGRKTAEKRDSLSPGT